MGQSAGQQRQLRSAQHAVGAAAAVLLLHVGHQLHSIAEPAAAVRAALWAPAAAAACWPPLLLCYLAAGPAAAVRRLGVRDQRCHVCKAGAALSAHLGPCRHRRRPRASREVDHICSCRAAAASPLLLPLSVLLQLGLHRVGGPPCSRGSALPHACPCRLASACGRWRRLLAWLLLLLRSCRLLHLLLLRPCWPCRCCRRSAAAAAAEHAAQAAAYAHAPLRCGSRGCRAPWALVVAR